MATSAGGATPVHIRNVEMSPRRGLKSFWGLLPGADAPGNTTQPRWGRGIDAINSRMGSRMGPQWHPVPAWRGTSQLTTPLRDTHRKPYGVSICSRPSLLVNFNEAFVPRALNMA